jgi:osomolarity two-component system response regulator SKN7
MVRILKKQLNKLLKNPAPPGSADDMPSPGVQQGPYAGAMAAQISIQQQMAANNAAAHMQHQQAAAAAAAMQAPGAQVKFEGTPMPSPTTTSSWHSPSQMPQHTSPTMDGGGPGGGGYMSAVGSGPMAMTPGGTQRPQYVSQVLPQIGTPTMGRMPDIMGGGPGPGPGDDRPEKRQRLAYGQSQGAYPQ